MICRKSWFSVRESGVGGIAVVDPMAREGIAGVEERKERRYLFGELFDCSWTY